MTESQKLQQEIDAMNAKFQQVKQAFTASDSAPQINKGYTYKKSTVIKAHDLAL